MDIQIGEIVPFIAPCSEGILLIPPFAPICSLPSGSHLLGCLVFLGDGHLLAIHTHTPKAWICVSLMRKQKFEPTKFSPQMVVCHGDFRPMGSKVSIKDHQLSKSKLATHKAFSPEAALYF